MHAYPKNFHYFLVYKKLVIEWFQKISIPPPWRELEIPEGGEGGQKPRKIQRRGGLNGEITFQRVNFDSFRCELQIKLKNYYLANL